MPEPTISLRDVKKARPVNGQDYVCLTVPERDALVDAVEATMKLRRCPLCGSETIYADGSPWEPHKTDCPLARFSDFGTEASS